MPATKGVEWQHSESQKHNTALRSILRYCGVLRILHAVPQILSSVLRHNTEQNACHTIVPMNVNARQAGRCVQLHRAVCSANINCACLSHTVPLHYFSQ